MVFALMDVLSEIGGNCTEPASSLDHIMGIPFYWRMLCGGYTCMHIHIV